MSRTTSLIAPSQSTLRRLTGIAGLTLLLTACGYKGPLYMPPPPAPSESLTTPPSDQTDALQASPQAEAGTEPAMGSESFNPGSGPQ